MGIVYTLVLGFALGGLARWAVPGPDPMPIWLTTLIGVVGAFIGGGIAIAIVGTDFESGNAFWILLAEVFATIGLVVAYRRVVQKRPITGPGAQEPPTRGFGLRRPGPK